MRDVPPNQSIFFRRFRSAGSSPRCATQSWLPAGSRIFGARNGSAAAKGASIFMRSTSRRDAAAALCGTGLVANPFVSALSLPRDHIATKVAHQGEARKECLRRAYDKAWRMLRDSGQPPIIEEIIAKRVIDLASPRLRITAARSESGFRWAERIGQDADTSKSI